jgi:hypothetical protein
MESDSPTLFSTFLIRMWRSPDGEWRGKATHFQTGEIIHFLNLAQFAGFLLEHAPGFSSSPGETGPEQTDGSS